MAKAWMKRRHEEPKGTSAGKSVTDLQDQRYSVAELVEELRRFEQELRAAGLKEASVSTYVDRSRTFLRWLDGKYHPRGPN